MKFGIKHIMLFQLLVAIWLAFANLAYWKLLQPVSDPMFAPTIAFSGYLGFIGTLVVVDIFLLCRILILDIVADIKRSYKRDTTMPSLRTPTDKTTG